MRDPIEDEVASAAREERQRRQKIDEARAKGWRLAFGFSVGGLSAGLIIALIGMPLFGAAKGCTSKPAECKESFKLVDENAYTTECPPGAKLWAERDPVSKKFALRCTCNLPDASTY